MKKLMLLGAAVAMLSVTACKKDYTCTCTVTEDSSGDVFSEAAATSKLSKKDAEAWCSTDDVSSGGYTTGCALTK